MKFRTLEFTINLMLALLLVLSFAFAVSAEDEGPGDEPIIVEPSGDATEIILEDFVPEDSPEGELANSILEAISAVVYLPAAAGIVTVGTSFIKRFTNFPAKFIALTIMTVLWGIYSVAQGLGYETQLDQILDAITQIGFVLVAATGTSIVSAKMYEQSARHNIPVVGFSRHVAELSRASNEANG